MPLYTPEPVTQFDNLEELGVFVMTELTRISALFAIGEFQSIRLDQINDQADLPRPRDGDLAYFTENAVGLNQQGLYEFDEQTTAWKKL